MNNTQQAPAPLAQGPSGSIPLLKSCESCRQRKIKCSGDKPTCAHCARRHQPCIYRRSARYKRRLNPGGGSSCDSAKDTSSSGVAAAKKQTSTDSLPAAAANNNGTINSLEQQQQTKGLVAAAMLGSTVEAVPMAGSEVPTAAVAAAGGGVDESLPLSTLFGTSLINESDILPPSILQSMNFWMNDSLLTASPTVATAPVNSLLQQQPPQPPISAPQYQISGNMNPLGAGGMYRNHSLANLVPMDVALGLPNLVTPVSPHVPTSGLPSNSSGAAPFLSNMQASNLFTLPPDFLQQLHNQVPSVAANSSATPSSEEQNFSARVQSPLYTSTSPNSLLQVDISNNQMLPFTTDALASLNLVASPTTTNTSSGILSGSLANSQLLSAVGNMQQQTQQVQQTQPVPGPFVSGAPIVVPSQASQQSMGGQVQSMPAAAAGSFIDGGGATWSPATASVSSPRTASFATPSVTRELLSRGVSSAFAKHFVANSPVLASHLQNEATSTPSSANNISSNTSQRASSIQPLSVSTSGPGRSDTGSNIHQHGISICDLDVHATDEPLGDNPYMDQSVHLNGSIGGSIGGSGRSRNPSIASTVSQLNNDVIPTILRDIVMEHPELGSAELLYNLLITHVVHDCSRIGIYSTRLFWMRVKGYEVPKYYLLATIADACRSWTLPEKLRDSLPANLDEICYALAVRDAPTDACNPSMVSVQALLMLSSYEFKSARFAPMLEHHCMAFKIITAVKFRGAPYPWRGVRKTPDANGMDWNYQLLIRSYWRLYITLHFSVEIFRIDAPEDKDFMPDLPQHDDFFAEHIFVPDVTQEFGFRIAAPPYPISTTPMGDLLAVLCELFIKQYKISNRFNKVLRGEKTSRSYIGYLREWDRQMVEWRDSLPHYLRGDLAELARSTQSLDSRRRRMNLEGLSENEMWQKRQEWNQGIGRTMEILYTHIMFDMARIKAHRIALMILLHEDLDMVRNFQYSKAFSVQELPCLTGSTAAATTMPILATYEDDAEAFQRSVQASSEAATHVYSLLKFTYEFGIDLHAFTTVIIGALFQLALVYVGRVQSCSPRMAWCAMLRLARILAMIRSLDRWGPALYIFTNILKALGRPELLLQAPSPQTRAELAAETSRSTFPAARSPSVDSSVDSLSCYQGDVGSGLGANKRKSCVGDIRGDEKRYEFMDHHHGDNPATVMAATGWSSPAEEEDVTNPFPPDHVITHIMREQKVNTATFFSPTLPILAASLLHTNSG